MDVDDQLSAVVAPQPLHFPRSFALLQDDSNCIQTLSRGPPDDPPFRLLFFFHILLGECNRNRKLAAETWLQVIEGGEGLEDLWLWEDGDEEWLKSNIKHPSFMIAQDNLLHRDWEQAGAALQRRISRAENRVVIHHSPRTRVFIIGWRLLVSRYMAEANKKRGLVPQKDSALDVRAWYEHVHQLFCFPDLNHYELRATFFPSFRGDRHQCAIDLAMINDWATMMSKIHFQENLVAICKKMCGCDSCAHR